jgi:hypothetical protein
MSEDTKKQKIVAYDDDALAIKERYSGLISDNDLHVVYFTSLDRGVEQIKDRLEKGGFPKDLVTIVDKRKIFDLAMGEGSEETEVPFPQDADQYFIDGLGYDRRIGVNGFVAVAKHLPKEKVTIVSADHETVEDAQRLGYSARQDLSA